VDVVVSGEVPLDPGYLIDYGEVTEAIRPVREELDHHVLNEIEGLSNPTAELLSLWIWNRLKPVLPLLTMVRVHETCTTDCEYRGE
jgi:6-pyruvoyltetrahydropterin/6-carboxytetrahydropterin synthase